MKSIILISMLIGASSIRGQENIQYGELNKSAPIETGQWSKLIGDWDCISMDLVEEDWIENKATWTWKYILDGYAVQDFWYQEDKDPNSKMKNFYGTNLRIYNPIKKIWEISWLNNKAMKIAPLFAKKEGDKILLFDEKHSFEVRFYEMKQNSFKWKAELINETGKRTLISEIFGARRM